MIAIPTWMRHSRMWNGAAGVWRSMLPSSLSAPAGAERGFARPSWISGPRAELPNTRH